MRKNRCYSELIKLRTFEDRYRYLKLEGEVGKATFGFDRYLNQQIYKDPRYRAARDKVIMRDDGCDLGISGREIFDRGFVHHMNPITKSQIENDDPDLFNPEYLIFTSELTHNAIHYGDETLLYKAPEERKPNDTTPWRK